MRLDIVSSIPYPRVMSFSCYRRSKALQSLCFLLYIVVPSLNKISYLILGFFAHLIKDNVLNDLYGRRLVHSASSSSQWKGGIYWGNIFFRGILTAMIYGRRFWTFDRSLRSRQNCLVESNIHGGTFHNAFHRCFFHCLLRYDKKYIKCTHLWLVYVTRKFAEWLFNMYHSVGHVLPCIVCILMVNVVKTSLTFKCLIEYLLDDFFYSRPLDTYLWKQMMKMNRNITYIWYNVDKKHLLFTKRKCHKFSWLFTASRCSPRRRSICACRITCKVLVSIGV